MSTAVKILIVDDEPDICYFLSASLNKRGFETSSTNTLADAEKQIAQDPPGLLLLDNHLPDGRGIEFLNSITSRYPDIKIVMISAHDSPQDRSTAFKNGSTFFLAKPFTIAAVNQVVDLVLSSNGVEAH